MLLKKVFEFFGLKKIMGIISSRWTIKNSYQRLPSPQSSNFNTKKIDYLIVDPSLPDVVKKMDPPVYNDKPPINVKGYKGGGFSRSSIEGQAANCFVTVTNTINYLNSQTTLSIPKWPGTSRLNIVPRAGVDLNACYDRSSLKFFHYSNHKIGSIFTCDSTDIVAHELGHAVLDAYRPESWSVMSLEVASMHEAFADLVAILHMLSYDEILNLVIQETNGDLNKENTVSKLAEHFGEAIYKISDPSSGRLPNALRSAINNFQYVNPASLPLEASNDQLAQECHSFGRVFLGVFYDLLIVFYETSKSHGMSQIEALKTSRDTLAKYALKAIQTAPLNAKFYQSVAKTMLWVDATLGDGKYQNSMQEVFRKRNLVATQLRALASPKCDNENYIIKKSNIRSLKLSDHVISAQAENFLFSVEIEVPNETAYLYDLNKNIFDHIGSSEDESISGAIDMITYIYNSKNVSNDSSTLFEIKNNKLIRSHFS